MRFCDLMSVGGNLLNAVEQQDLRGEMFETEFASISQGRMQLWKINQAIPATGERFLFGVDPSWNFYDLYLLDCINDSLKMRYSDEIFEVLNLDVITDMTGIQSVFGNITPRQEPILGIWKDGILSKSFWGWEAKTF